MFAILAATAAKAPAKLTVMEKLQAVPKETWISLLITFAVIFMIVRVWKSLKEINDIVPWIALFTVGGAVVFYWTYERTEPKMLSPIFDQLSKILPSRIEYKDAKTP
jgi:hypothetical protein